MRTALLAFVATLAGTILGLFSKTPAAGPSVTLTLALAIVAPVAVFAGGLWFAVAAIAGVGLGILLKPIFHAAFGIDVELFPLVRVALFVVPLYPLALFAWLGVMMLKWRRSNEQGTIAAAVQSRVAFSLFTLCFLGALVFTVNSYRTLFHLF
jgi:hypothetical protein